MGRAARIAGEGGQARGAPPLLSRYARAWKLSYFFAEAPLDARILEAGCGDGWLGRALAARGFTDYTGLDLHAGADVVGDVRAWRRLGLEAESFDIVAAFELVEHVDCWEALAALLRPGGWLFATSPVPWADGLCRALEICGLSQRRTSPHAHLVDFRRVPGLRLEALRRPAGIAQWGKFRKPERAEASGAGAAE